MYNELLDLFNGFTSFGWCFTTFTAFIQPIDDLKKNSADEKKSVSNEKFQLKNVLLFKSIHLCTCAGNFFIDKQ